MNNEEMQESFYQYLIWSGEQDTEHCRERAAGRFFKKDPAEPQLTDYEKFRKTAPVVLDDSDIPF